MRILLLTALALTAMAGYSNVEAHRNLVMASYAYCSEPAMEKCGAAGAAAQNLGAELYAFENLSQWISPISAVLLTNSKTKEIIVGFSGTENPGQLVSEMVHSILIPYTIHNVDQAQAMDYFYKKYIVFRDFIL